MSHVKKTLIEIAVVLSFTGPALFWFIGFLKFFTSISEMSNRDLIHLFFLLFLGAGGFFGVASCLWATSHNYKLLFNRYVTLAMLLSGLVAVCMLWQGMMTPIGSISIGEHIRQLIFLPFWFWFSFWLPLICLISLIFIFRKSLFINNKI